jgi:hypothetical protein
LVAYPECDVAHCCLDWIDGDGNTFRPNPWAHSMPCVYFGELMQRYHIRMAPHDGYLHFFLHTIYMSLTQLLIRRSAFERTGLFPCSYGSLGDFCWGMKASLTSNIIHVPRYLATWRRHPGQLTNDEAALANQRRQYTLFLLMGKEAIGACNKAPMTELSLHRYYRDLRRPYLSQICRDIFNDNTATLKDIGKVMALSGFDPFVIKLILLRSFFRGYRIEIDLVEEARRFIDSHHLGELVRVC